MSAHLPDWASTIPGFDSSGWWCPIVCMGVAPNQHAVELLGIVFDQEPGSGIGGLHWSPAPGRITPEMLTKEEHEALVASGTRGTSTGRRGSINSTCPNPDCARTVRIPRDRWSRILENARSVEPPWVDLSLYG